MNSFSDRINLNITLEEFAKKVCEKYSIGKLLECRLIEIGYEDYNFYLKTNQGEYVVKVFNKNRSDEACANLVQRATVPFENNFACPQIFKGTDGKMLCQFVLNGVCYRLLLMEYISGKDFFSLEQNPTKTEMKFIATELAKLNNLDFKPPFIYDRWAIVNYNKEYNENKKIISEKHKKFLEKAYNLYNSIDFSKLKYGFVHGDIIKTNILKDENGKLYFIDFSVSNYLPRIVDLAVTIGDLCFNSENFDEIIANAHDFIKNYENLAKLSDYEKECLKKFLYVHQAITVLETTREKIIEHNMSKENEEFLCLGEKALDLLERHNFI